MRIDPQVNRMKFDRELGRLIDQRSILETRGIFVLTSTAFPCVDILVVPRHSLNVAVPSPPGTQLPPGVQLPPPPPGLPEGVKAMMMVAFEVPSLAARAFKGRFDLTDYDLRAPSLEFRDPWTDALLAYATMFRAVEFEEQRKGHLVLLDDHPITHKPFLCLRGIREYHEHPQHSGDDWMLYRQTLSLFSIVMSLWRVSVDISHPQLVIQPNGIQVLFNTEAKV
jgi:Predicted metal binding domain